MKAVRKIIRIGNSQGIVLPKNIMYYAQMNDAFYLNVVVERGKITLTPKTIPDSKKK